MIILQKEDFIKLRGKLQMLSEKVNPIQFNYLMKLDAELNNAIENFEINNTNYIELYNRVNKFIGE